MTYEEAVAILKKVCRDDNVYLALQAFLDAYLSWSTAEFGKFSASDAELRYASTAKYLINMMKKTVTDMKEMSNKEHKE